MHKQASSTKVLNQINTSSKRSALFVEPDHTSIWSNNGKRENCHYYVHAQLLYRIHESCNHVKNNILHIASFIFSITFIKDCFIFCSFICMLIPFADFVMERVLSRTYLGVLICIFITDFAALLLLHWQLIHQPQTWIKILKCALNFTLIILLALDIAEEIDNDKQRFVWMFIWYSLTYSFKTAWVLYWVTSSLLYHISINLRDMCSVEDAHQV